MQHLHQLIDEDSVLKELADEEYLWYCLLKNTNLGK